MSHRIERLGSLIRQELSELIQREVKDPRLGEFVAVTDVCLSPDLKYARVFVSHLGSQEERKSTLDALASAAGFFRGHMAKHLRLRHIPELNFVWDDSIERGALMEALIDEVCAREEPKSDETAE